MEFNIGNIEFYNEVEIGDLKLDIEKVYPSLEDIEITPRAFNQEFNHPESYGYDKVTVKAMAINLQDKEVIPSVNEKIITADKEYDGLKQINVKAVDNTIDSNITPNNIKEGISILGITGTSIPLKSCEVTVAPSFNEQVITPTEGANGIIKVIVNPIILNTQDKTVIPSNEQQIITKDDEYDALGTVTVEPIPNNLYDITITANGTYQAPEGYLGIGTATVNVTAQGIPETQLYTYSEEDWT